MFIPAPDLDILPIPDPRSKGQKGTGLRIWIRNTGNKNLTHVPRSINKKLFLFFIFCNNFSDD